MKTYKRSDFIKLPAMTIYSRVDPIHGEDGELLYGLFCKTSSKDELENDWVEQSLLTEILVPDDITDGFEIFEQQLKKRDSGFDFEMDFDLAGRDGLFDDADRFVVWGKNDIIKLIEYLNNCIL